MVKHSIATHILEVVNRTSQLNAVYLKLGGKSNSDRYGKSWRGESKGRFDQKHLVYVCKIIHGVHKKFSNNLKNS